MKGSLGITFTEDRNIINIEYECGCKYNHFPENLDGIWCSTWTSLCSGHNKAIKSLTEVFSDGGNESTK